MKKIIQFTIFTLLLFSFFWTFFPKDIARAQSAAGCWVTQVGTPGEDVEKPTCTGNGQGIPTGSIDGACAPTDEYPTDLKQSLKDDYDITLNGYDEEHTKYIYDLFQCLSGTKFGSLVYGTTLINGTTYIEEVGETIGMGCDSTCNIWITQMPGRPTAFKFILTHEFGHVIYYHNPGEVTHKNEFITNWETEGGLSAYSRRDGESDCKGGASFEEDYAETVAYFLHPNAGEATGQCNSDDDKSNPLYTTSKYPLHVDVIKKVLLQ